MILPIATTFFALRPSLGRYIEVGAWQNMWAELGVTDPPQRIYDNLISRYSERHRHYHTLEHLAECLQVRRNVDAKCTNPAEVDLALWFHDAIYDPTRHDNEDMSAQWLDEVAGDCGLSDGARRRLSDLVMATRHNTYPESDDQAVLVDTDLAILGAPIGRFDEYDRQIRREYNHVPEFLYRRKRAQVLQGFLGRERIYSTDPYFEAFERQARENLARALEGLKQRR